MYEGLVEQGKLASVHWGDVGVILIVTSLR